MASARLLAACFLALFATRAVAADPHPPQLNVSFLAEPAPIVQDGSTRLVYEMLVTNFSGNRYILDTVEAKAGAAQFQFSGPALADMIIPLGGSGKPDGAAGRTIDGGRSLVVFLFLDLGAHKAPAAIGHTVRLTDDKNATHAVTLAPLAVSNETPIVVAPPLRGTWIAGDSVSSAKKAAHRRTVLLVDGHAWLAQRYAIDWLQTKTVNGVRTTWKGPEDRNDSYFCYDQPIYSVAAGKVVDMADGLPENVPHSGRYAIPIDFNNAAGNHVVVEIAPGRYVLYAHMRPGTVKVRVGELVRTGEILGHVGNTGSSVEPHLHMHIDDRPSFLAGNGVPYEFTQEYESGPVNANVSSPTVISFGPVGQQRPFRNDYPAANALVTFR
ncbi:MAG TPA: M23 family metallopeptidase [Rhizomicrobium sp.]|nr:M23 family metallopeptidase [Rhizomicrobium sp.]